MALLLYKSDEMFSATQLIRQSKMIFDKVVNNEIEKAIILRDGKPGFLLMDFEKYEKIMADYEKLKAKVARQKKTKSIQKEKEDIPKATIVEPTIEENTIDTIKDEPKPKSLEKQEQTPIKEELTVQQEIDEAMKSIDSMNFTDSMKDLAKEKIKAKIIQARAQRARELKAQQDHEKEDLKEELELQAKVLEKKRKKEKELEEFWD